MCALTNTSQIPCFQSELSDFPTLGTFIEQELTETHIPDWNENTVKISNIHRPEVFDIDYQENNWLTDEDREDFQYIFDGILFSQNEDISLLHDDVGCDFHLGDVLHFGGKLPWDNDFRLDDNFSFDSPSPRYNEA